MVLPVAAAHRAVGGKRWCRCSLSTSTKATWALLSCWCTTLQTTSKFGPQFSSPLKETDLCDWLQAVPPLRFVAWSRLLWFTSVFKFSSVQQKRADNFLKFLKFSKHYTNASYLATKYLRCFACVFMNNFLKGLWHTCTIIWYGNWRKKEIWEGCLFLFFFFWPLCLEELPSLTLNLQVQ